MVSFDRTGRGGGVVEGTCSEKNGRKGGQCDERVTTAKRRRTKKGGQDSGKQRSHG